MIRVITPYIIICGSLVHIFCCGIPLLLSISSLASIIGIHSLAMFEVEWFEAIEGYVLLISGFLLIVTIAADQISKKMNCVESNVCQHEPCDKKKRVSSYMLKIALILYSLNLLTLILQ